MKRDRIKKDKLSSKEVLEYLSWIADANYLYDVALATFDLKLAVMVAETTQKDPKEYLPYIEGLRSIPDEVDRRFKICLDTKRFDQAILTLSQGSGEQIDKAMSIIKEKKLFTEGLSAFRNNPKQLAVVREMLADDLVAQREYKQAAPYYLANGSLDKCLNCYSQTLDWEAATDILEPDEKDAFLKKMKDEYVERKNFVEAARILRSMSSYNKREYVTLLVERGDDFRALKKLYFRADDAEDQDIVATIIKPKLDLQAEIAISTYTKKTQEVATRKARLTTVQEMKKDQTILTVGVANEVVDGKSGRFDNVSEMSYESKGTAGISVVTGASSMSKKMKKPRNLVKRNIQENSPFEEDYLVEKLNELKLEDNELRDVSSLLDCLLLFGMVDKAKEIIEVVER